MEREIVPAEDDGTAGNVVESVGGLVVDIVRDEDNYDYT